MDTKTIFRLVVEVPEELTKRLDAEVDRTYSTRKAVICRLLKTLPEVVEKNLE